VTSSRKSANARAFLFTFRREPHSVCMKRQIPQCSPAPDGGKFNVTFGARSRLHRLQSVAQLLIKKFLARPWRLSQGPENTRQVAVTISLQTHLDIRHRLRRFCGRRVLSSASMQLGNRSFAFRAYMPLFNGSLKTGDKRGQTSCLLHRTRGFRPQRVKGPLSFQSSPSERQSEVELVILLEKQIDRSRISGHRRFQPASCC